MKKLAIFTLAIAVALIYTHSVGFAAPKEMSGKHYNLNIIGFAKCEYDNDLGDYPDCYKGKGDKGSMGHTLFVPLNMTTYECGDGYDDDQDITVAELLRGVRILVTDGDDMYIIDRDATDGRASFSLPDGDYEIYARALGKPGGCMDIDTITCSEWVTDHWEQVDCNPTLDDSIKYSLVGHLSVKRTKGTKPTWQKATSALLPAEVGVKSNDYFDFFWQVYNNNLRLLQLRIYEAS